MPSSYSFLGCSRVGALGISATREFLEKHPESVSVLSVESDRRFQPIGIDFLWIRFQGAPRMEPVEVKTDTHTSGNFYLETRANVEREKPGWLHTTQSLWLAYYFVQSGHLYLLSTLELARWFAQSRYNSPAFEKTTFTRSGSGGYHSNGVPVPILEVLEHVPHVQSDARSQAA